MWIKKGVNNIYGIDESEDSSNDIASHLRGIKMSLEVCQFLYDVIINTDDIQSTAKPLPGLEEMKENDINIFRERHNREFDAKMEEYKYRLKKANKSQQRKIQRLINKRNEYMERVISDIAAQYDEFIDCPFIVKNIPDCNRQGLWSLMAGFIFVSLSDRNFNLIDNRTWEEIFQGRFKQMAINNKKSIDSYLQEKFDSKSDNAVIKKLKPEILDPRNKRRERQIENLPENIIPIVLDYTENGPFMDSSVIDAMYKVMKANHYGTTIGVKDENIAKRYLQNFDEEHHVAVFKDDNDQNFVFRFVPDASGSEGVLEIEITSLADASDTRRVVYYNPKGAKTGYGSDAVLSEYILTTPPKCYTSNGELIEVVPGEKNKFLYQYVKMLRNNFAHASYNIYNNPFNNDWVCTGNEGAELHYSFSWFQILQTTFSKIDQILFGENSVNRGSLGYYDVVQANTNIKTNNIFTIAILPELKEKFKSNSSVCDYLKKGSFYSIEINDDIPLSEVKELLHNITTKLSSNYTQYYRDYESQLNRFKNKIASQNLKSSDYFVALKKEETRLVLELEDKVKNKIMLELGKDKLFGDKKLRDYIVTPISKTDRNTDINEAVSKISMMMYNADCFALDKNGDAIMSLEDQKQKLYEALELGENCSLKLAPNKCSDVVDYKTIGFLMDAIADSNMHPDCKPKFGGDEDNFCVNMEWIRQVNLHKESVLSSLGSFAMYCALLATGYADTMSSPDSKFYGIDALDATNLCSINMKELHLKRYNGTNEIPVTISNKLNVRLQVISTLRNAVAHGNIKTEIIGSKGKIKPQDVVFSFADVNCANGKPGMKVEMSLAGLMRFVSSPIFTEPTCKKPKSITEIIKANQLKYGFEVVEEAPQKVTKVKKVTTKTPKPTTTRGGGVNGNNRPHLTVKKNNGIDNPSSR